MSITRSNMYAASIVKLFPYFHFILQDLALGAGKRNMEFEGLQKDNHKKA